MSATSARAKALIKREGTIDGAIDEVCHRIVFFKRAGMPKLERIEQKTLEWLKAEKDRTGRL